MDKANSYKIEKPQSLKEKVYLWIKDQVLSGELPPGEPIVETKLAGQLGVSRTPVHQAIIQLEQEGFVASVQFKGFFVGGISSRDIREIYQLREILETHLLRETAKQFTEEELEQIEFIIQAADEALQSGDVASFLEANRAFHHSFARKYDNQRISDILANLDEHLYRILSFEFQTQPDKLLASQREHKLMLEAIREGDVESAVSLLRKHLKFADTFLDGRWDAERGGEGE